MTSDNQCRDELANLFMQSIKKADQLRRDLTEFADLTGYIADRLKVDEPYWLSLADYPEIDPEYAQVVACGMQFMRAYKKQIYCVDDQYSDPSSILPTLARFAATFDANTSSLSDVTPIFKGNEKQHQPCPFLPRKDVSSRAESLAKVDHGVADSFRQVWKTLHRVDIDPERIALHLMMQTYSHFFQILSNNISAPIAVPEHIEYAAQNRVKKKVQIEMICACSIMILKVCNELIKAQACGEYDPIKARKTVYAMDKILADWINALEL
jgi:hypothetical protein